MNKKNLLGRQFEKLTVIGASEPRKDKNGSHSRWLCQCECGNEKEVLGYLLTTGRTTSCGCLRSPSYAKNNNQPYTDTRLYSTWEAMKRRCYNSNTINYKYYGSIGVEVSEEWKNDYESFSRWAIDNGWDETMAISRINDSGDYSPSNCEIKSKTENAREANYRRWGELNAILY
jgi:hypothetical protein